MSERKRIFSVGTALVLMLVCLCSPVFAAEQGTASIGFSIGASGGGDIVYVPAGISGIEETLNLDFGNHEIDLSQVGGTASFPSENTAGYVVENSTGGLYGYRVTLGLSSFDNGLEGAWLTIYPDSNGLVTDRSDATDAPVFLNGRSSLQLDSDGSTMVVLEASDYSDPWHTGLGRWGFNFTGDLGVYTSTIRPGNSRSVMTWEIQIT